MQARDFPVPLFILVDLLIFNKSAATTTNVVNTLFCSSCTDFKRSLYYEMYEEIPNYAILTQDPNPLLPSSFTVCLGVSVTTNIGQQVFFSIRGQNGEPFLATAFSDQIDGRENNVGLDLVLGSSFINKAFELRVFPNQWVHSCLSLSFETGMVEWVIDGQIALSANASTTWNKELMQAARNRPTNLKGKVILGAIETPGGWMAPGHHSWKKIKDAKNLKVCSPNIFFFLN